MAHGMPPRDRHAGPGDAATFGALLRRHRLAAGLTQEALAERAGLSPDAISLLERGLRTVPRRDTVDRLAGALALSPDERLALTRAASRSGAPRQARSARTQPAGRTDRGRWPVLAMVSIAAVLAVVPDTVLGGLRLLPHLFPNGVVQAPQRNACDPTGAVAPAGPARQTGIADVRYSFEQPTEWPWTPFARTGDVRYGVTSDAAADGSHSLKVLVGPGDTRIGTTSVPELHPGSIVTIHVWYGGQGAGLICPFIQNTRSETEWVQVRSLTLAPSDDPGWRPYTWTMPADAAIAIGLQFHNTTANDFMVLLDEVSW